MDPHWSAFIRKSLRKVFGQSGQNLPFLAKLHAAWSFITWSMGRCGSARKQILKRRKVAATHSVAPTSNAPLRYFPGYFTSPPLSSSSELVPSDPFCPTIVSFLSRSCVLVSSPTLSSFGDRRPSRCVSRGQPAPRVPREMLLCCMNAAGSHPRSTRSALLLAVLEEGRLCSQMTLMYFLLKIILESSLSLPRRKTPAKETAKGSELNWMGQSLIKIIIYVIAFSVLPTPNLLPTACRLGWHHSCSIISKNKFTSVSGNRSFSPLLW